MTRPTDIPDFGEAVYDQLAPVADQDEANGWDLLNYVGAIGAMFDLMDRLAHSNPSWSLMVDVDNCPVEGLSWLGQCIGVTVNTNLSEAAQRQQIRDHLGWQRGTLATIKNAVKPYLTGTQTVIIKERDTSAYHFTISTLLAETPSDLTYQNLYNSYATYAAYFAANVSYAAYWNGGGRNQIIATINANKPAGDQFTYTVI